MFLKKEISSDEINLQVTGPLNGEPANEFQKNLEDLAVGSHKIITLNLKEVNSIIQLIKFDKLLAIER